MLLTWILRRWDTVDYRLDWFVSGLGHLESSFECDKELSLSKKCREILDWLVVAPVVLIFIDLVS
jgi:hypothetical protein